MQVLVLAAQNAVPYKHARRRHLRLDALPPDRRRRSASRSSARSSRTGSPRSSPSGCPRGVHVPAAANPALVHHLPRGGPAAVHRGVHGGDPPDLPRRGRLRDRRLPPHLAAARGAAARDQRRAEGIGESFAAPREDRSDRELERIISSIASGRMRARDLRADRRRVRVDLTPAEAWLLGRLATSGTLEHRETKAATPEEIAGLTADLLHRGYLTIEPASGRLELSDRGQQAHARARRSGPLRAHPHRVRRRPAARRRSPTSCAASRSRSWPTSRETQPARRGQPLSPPPRLPVDARDRASSSVAVK